MSKKNKRNKNCKKIKENKKSKKNKENKNSKKNKEIKYADQINILPYSCKKKFKIREFCDIFLNNSAIQKELIDGKYIFYNGNFIPENFLYLDEDAFKKAMKIINDKPILKKELKIVKYQKKVSPFQHVTSKSSDFSKTDKKEKNRYTLYRKNIGHIHKRETVKRKKLNKDLSSPIKKTTGVNCRAYKLPFYTNDKSNETETHYIPKYKVEYSVDMYADVVDIISDIDSFGTIEEYLNDKNDKTTVGSYLKEVIHKKKIKNHKLAEITGIDAGTISEYLNDRRKQQKEYLIAIIIALRLTFKQGKRVLDIAEISLDNPTIENQLYIFFLIACAFNPSVTVKKCNQILIEKNCKPLTYFKEEKEEDKKNE